MLLRWMAQQPTELELLYVRTFTSPPEVPVPRRLVGEAARLLLRSFARMILRNMPAPAEARQYVY
jgi:hypothetical protein